MIVLSYTTVDFSHTSEKFTNPYRYGFNGMERDDETYGKGNALDFGARIYDSRLGRWLKQGFYFRVYPSQSAFNFGLNWPINILDIDGNTIVPMRYIFFFS